MDNIIQSSISRIRQFAQNRFKQEPIKSPVSNYTPQNQGQYNAPTFGSLAYKANNVKRAILKPFAKTQDFIEKDKTPRLDLPDRVQKVPLAGMLAQGFVEGTVNIPSNLMRASAQTGKDIRTGDILKPQVALSNAAKIASPFVDIATLGAGSSIVKQGAKAGIKKIAPKAVVEGMKYGGIYGGLSGIEEGRTADSVQDQFKNATKDAATGAIIGGSVAGLFLGAAKGVSGAKNKVISEVANRVKNIYGDLDDKKANKIASDFVRDELGRFTKGNKNINNEPLFYGELRKSLGLPEDGNYNKGFVDIDEIGKVGQPPKPQPPKAKLTSKGEIVLPKSDVKVEPPDVLRQPIKSTPVKLGKNATPDEVRSTIPDRIDSFMQETAGYSTQELKGGTKGANWYQRKMRNTDAAISKYIEKGLVSQNPIFRKTSAVLHGFFKELGTSIERQEAQFQMKGGMAAGTQRAYDVGESLYKMVGGTDTKSLERIDAVLDPQASNLKVTFNQLTDAEKQTYLLIRKGLDLVHDISYSNGSISKELYQQNKGKYTPLLFEVFEAPAEVNRFANSNPLKIDNSLYKKKKELTQWKKDNKLTDPIYALTKRLAQVESNKAVKKYTDFIASQKHLISDIPLEGFIKLSDSPAYGSLQGKYVAQTVAEELQGHFFASQGLNALYDAFKSYDRLPIRQLQKKLLTVFNPTTNIGNITTDNIFGGLVGVDPFTLNKNLVYLMNNKSKNKQVVDYLMREGVIGTDITRTDFVNNIGKIDSLKQKQGTMGKLSEKIQSFYGGTDDMYKAASFKSLIDQGKTLEEATRLVKDGFQNYKNVGKFYDFAAKTPVVGAPFIKFQADLMRIIKNTAINKPLHLITFLGTLKLMSEITSRASGETQEEKEARESRFGTNKIPGLDIPLNWQTPWGEINVARYISPLYATDLGGDEGVQTLSKVLPFFPEIGRNNEGNIDVLKSIALNTNDPLVSPLVQAGVDFDFRGKSISDPKKSPYFGSDLPQDTQNQNRAKFLARSYAGPQINNILDIKAAIDGKEDQYGRERTVKQAIARALGIKVERITPEKVKEGQQISDYYDAKDPAFKKLNKDEKAALLAIPKQNADDTRAKMVKYQTFLQYPAVFNYNREIAINKVKGDTTKVDPIYLYPEEDVRKFMLYQSMGGSDLGTKEAKDYYKSEPVIGEISQARSEFYKKNPIEGTDYQSSRPVPSARVQSLMDQGAWSNPEVKAYLEANTAWKNAQREKIGLPPLAEYGSGGFGNYTKKPKKVKIGKPRKVTLKKAGGTFKTKKIKTPKIKTISTPKIKAVKLDVKIPKVRVKKFKA